MLYLRVYILGEMYRHTDKSFCELHFFNGDVLRILVISAIEENKKNLNQVLCNRSKY